jgi:hypothetical protein
MVARLPSSPNIQQPRLSWRSSASHMMPAARVVRIAYPTAMDMVACPLPLVSVDSTTCILVADAVEGSSAAGRFSAAIGPKHG